MRQFHDCWAKSVSSIPSGTGAHKGGANWHFGWLSAIHKAVVNMPNARTERDHACDKALQQSQMDLGSFWQWQNNNG